MIFQYFQCLYLTYSEVAWVLVLPSWVLPSRLSFRFLWLCLELLQNWSTCKNLCPFYKITKGFFLEYLSTIVATQIPEMNIKLNFFVNIFSLSAITEWIKHDLNIRISSSLSVFVDKLLDFSRHFSQHNILLRRLKYITWLKLGFNGLHKH